MKYDILINYLNSFSTFLMSTFDNVHDRGRVSVGGMGEQPWTPELKASVSEFLLHHLPEGVEKWFFPTREKRELNQEQIDVMFEQIDVSELALYLREAAIASELKFESLATAIADLPYEERAAALTTWFDVHTTEQDRRMLAQQLVTVNELDAPKQATHATNNAHVDPEDLAYPFELDELQDAWRATFDGE